jgi:hypothetical protein
LVWRKEVRLYVRVRKNNKGAYIASVPLKAVKVMAGKAHRSWFFEDGWLVLVSN